MKEYQYNDATRLMEDKITEYDFDSSDFPGKADMEALDPVATFSEYVHKHAVRCGYTNDTADTGALATFVSEKCKEAQVNISRQTLVNWLTKGLPANTASGRENVYRLCFALQMDAQQTGEFFLKAYLERPFNYKDIHEATYFFCLNSGYPYTDAQRIIATIESSQVEENSDADNITEQIGQRISELKTEDEFLRYMTENRSGFAIQNQSATEKIKEIIDKCKELAPKEYAINCDDDKAITADNVDELLNIIYGYSARATANGEAIYKKTISKSNFPDLIKRNWPQREQFSQILEKKTASYDVIRRALIMLTFYDFAASAAVAEYKRTGAAADEFFIFTEFTDEMNTVLAECGYVQLYWRNPFDWMIGYCAMSPDPLGTLRDLIDEYYLSDSEVLDQFSE